MSAQMGNFEIKDGEYTKVIYSMIKEQRYNDFLITGNRFLFPANINSVGLKVTIIETSYFRYFKHISLRYC